MSIHAIEQNEATTILRHAAAYPNKRDRVSALRRIGDIISILILKHSHSSGLVLFSAFSLTFLRHVLSSNDLPRCLY